MAPFTTEQVGLIEELIHAMIQYSKPHADYHAALVVTKVKIEMVTDPVLVELLDKHKVQNNGQKETT